MAEAITQAQRGALEILTRFGFVVRVDGGFWIAPDFEPRPDWWKGAFRGQPYTVVLTLRAMQRKGLVCQSNPGTYANGESAQAMRWSWPFALTVAGYAVAEGAL